MEREDLMVEDRTDYVIEVRECLAGGESLLLWMQARLDYPECVEYLIGLTTLYVGSTSTTLNVGSTLLTPPPPRWSERT